MSTQQSDLDLPTDEPVQREITPMFYAKSWLGASYLGLVIVVVAVAVAVTAIWFEIGHAIRKLKQLLVGLGFRLLFILGGTVMDFDHQTRDRLRASYNIAVREGRDQFRFDGQEFVTVYAKYLLQHLDYQLGDKTP